MTTPAPAPSGDIVELASVDACTNFVYETQNYADAMEKGVRLYAVISDLRAQLEEQKRLAFEAFGIAVGHQEHVAALEKVTDDLSSTLLTIRPLGGSECFSRVYICGDERYYADTRFFRRVIAEDREVLRAAKMKAATSSDSEGDRK